MNIIKMKQIVALVALLIITGLTSAVSAAPAAYQDGPELPSPLCDRVRAPEGNQVLLRLYATGTQNYRWDGTSWVFVEPVATLFANPEYDGRVGIHYRGPVWESISGSKVTGARLFGCQPDSTAIPWLLLEAVSTSGPGLFRSVTYIQRVNTTGGLAPATPGSSVGEVAAVPYTAEYYFYSEN